MMEDLAWDLQPLESYNMNGNNTYMKAIQLTRVLIPGSCLGAFIVFYQTGFVQWHYAIAMAISSAVGSQIGLLALPKVPLEFAKYYELPSSAYLQC
jgi:uncharacterized protein